MDDRYTAVDPPSGIDPRLLEDIRAGNCVALVGAGFSAAAGLPAWPDLVRAVARQLPAADQEANRATIEQLMGAGPQGYSHRELEMAAQLLFDAVGEERCRHLLRDSLRPDRLPPVMQRRLKPPAGHPAAQPTLDAPDRPVVQLHGTLVHDSTLVFTRSQYRRRLYASPAYLTALKALLATSTVLFIGYSMRDAYLNELRAELIEAFQTSEAASNDASRADPGLAMLHRPLAWAVLQDVSRQYYERHEGLGVIARGSCCAQRPGCARRGRGCSPPPDR